MTQQTMTLSAVLPQIAFQSLRQRVVRELARTRQRQLDLARAGRFRESARYAKHAEILRARLEGF